MGPLYFFLQKGKKYKIVFRILLDGKGGRKKVKITYKISRETGREKVRKREDEGKGEKRKRDEKTDAKGEAGKGPDDGTAEMETDPEK